MKAYMVKDTKGNYCEAGPELAERLEFENPFRPINICYAMPIKHGTGSCVDDGIMYRWSTVDGWRVIYYPAAGGSEAYVMVDGIGWVVDTEDAMPHEVWIILLRAAGAPVDQMA